MSGIFLALVCALCFASLSFAAELWHFHRRLSNSNVYSRRFATSKRLKRSSEKRYLKVDVFVPDGYQVSTVLKELERLHRDTQLRFSLPQNS